MRPPCRRLKGSRVVVVSSHARPYPRADVEIAFGGKVSCCPPRSGAGRMEGGVNRATHIQVQLFSECSPADGMGAAAKNGTSARPTRQLYYQATLGSLTRERGNVGSC